jgi:hypothetical protein
VSRVSVALWLLRVTWLVLPVAMVPCAADALADRSTGVAAVTAALLWLAWGAGLVALLVPSTSGLTAVRSLAPAAPLVAVGAALGDAGGTVAVLAVALTLAAAVLAFTGEVGKAFVQGSAYGDERRHLLRPPGTLVLGPVELLWLVMVVAATAGPLLLGARQWVAGVLATVVGLPLAWLLLRRFHRLSRRWLVLVPAGLVVHDSLALAENAMVRTNEVRRIEPALAGTEAFDLTVRALGTALEVQLKDSTTLVLPGTLQQRQGSSVHARSFLVSPTRPGQVLADAASRGLAVPPPSTSSSDRS